MTQQTPKKKFTAFTDAHMPTFSTDFAAKHAPKLTLKPSKDEATGSFSKEERAILQLKRVGLFNIAEKLKNKKNFLGDLVRLATNSAEAPLTDEIKKKIEQVQNLQRKLRQSKASQDKQLEAIRGRLVDEFGEGKASEILR